MEEIKVLGEPRLIDKKGRIILPTKYTTLCGITNKCYLYMVMVNGEYSILIKNSEFYKDNKK